MRHLKIEYEDVGFVMADGNECVRAIRACGYDLEVPLTPEQLLQAFENDAVIICKNESNQVTLPTIPTAL
jgi:hypothetical protein